VSNNRGVSRRKKARRKPRGQPGQRDHWRGLAPLSRVDQVIELFPPKRFTATPSRPQRRQESRVSLGKATPEQVLTVVQIERALIERRLTCLADVIVAQSPFTFRHSPESRQRPSRSRSVSI